MSAPKRLLGWAEVIDRVGLGRTQIARLLKEGRFPTPVELAPRRVAFLESEIESWIDERLAHRDTPEARAAREARSAHFAGIVGKRWAAAKSGG